MNIPFSKPTRRAILHACLTISLAAAAVPARAGNPPKPAGTDLGAPRPLQADSTNEEKARKSLSYAKQIGLALNLYALDNSGAFPATLDALKPDYMDAEMFKKLTVSPFAPNEPLGYTYHTGLKTDAAPKTILLEDKFAPKASGQKILFYVDSSSEITK